MAKLASGLDMQPDEPVYHLRERLLKHTTTVMKMPSNYVVALYFRAWIATKQGRRLRALSIWRPENGEAFPDIGPLPGVAIGAQS